MEEVEGVLSVEGEEEAVTAVVAVEEEEEEEVVVAVEEETVVVVEEEEEGTVLVMTKSPVRRRRRLLQAFIARTCFLLLLGIFKNFGKKTLEKTVWQLVYRCSPAGLHVLILTACLQMFASWLTRADLGSWFTGVRQLAYTC